MDGYELLAKAIILQAVKDYRKALKYDARGRKREIERFFRSEYFSTLTNISGEMLIQKLRAEVKEVVIK
nr:MAG TPA: hypothetical protein [Caudoviricetes sp.]